MAFGARPQRFVITTPRRRSAQRIRWWWSSRLRGRRFAQLIHQARELTQERISLGAVERGEAGRREAMPYFFAVLWDLVNQEQRSHGKNSTN